MSIPEPTKPEVNEDDPPDVLDAAATRPLSRSALTVPLSKPRHRWWEKVRFDKIALFIASLYLFILAISLM